MKKPIFKFVSFAILTLLFSSCLTVSKIERNCDKFAKICIAETIKETVYRDTTIYKTDTLFYKLPGDTVKISDTIRIENNQAILKPVTKQIGLIGVSAYINNNWLNVNAWLTDSTILIPYRDTIFLPDAFATTSTTKTVIVEKKYIPWFYKFTFWLFLIQIIAAAMWIGLTIYGGKIFRFLGKVLKK